MTDMCSVCREMKPIITGYPECFHIVLCVECKEILEENPNGPDDTFLCVMCRTPSRSIKIIHR